MQTEVLVVGGGVGGCAAALSAAANGARVVVVEPTRWIGGQLTSQCVPPDEHPWIEEFGSTERYRFFRDTVRWFYEDHYDLRWAEGHNAPLNPGGAWVSAIAHEPRVALQALHELLLPFTTSGRITVLEQCEAIAADVQNDAIRTVTVRDKTTQRTFEIEAKVFLDATEEGEFGALVGAEGTTGSESRNQTGEPHAPESADPDNQQAITWCCILGYDPEGNHVIDRPSRYDFWRAYQPPFWPGPLLGWDDVHPWTGQARTLQLFPGPPGDNVPLWTYRRIVAASHHRQGVAHDATVVNWPMNDYFEGPIVGVAPDVRAARLEDSRQLTLSLVYWMQTEAPRPDGGTGYPGLYLCPHLSGTPDGLAMAPYIREARRLQTVYTVVEQDVTPEGNPGRRLARAFPDSVGIGFYRIDLHPSTGGDNYLDITSLPFQIPLRSLIPVRVRNLIAAGKAMGTTHITNGCYRLHPVEWNVGESAGVLAAYCLAKRLVPVQVAENDNLLAELQDLLAAQGVELDWPDDIELPAWIDIGPA